MPAIHSIEAKGLHILAKAENFNKWMYKSISHYTRGNILEIGSGIGNISKLFVLNGATISLSETDPFYFEQLKKEFSKYSNVNEILQINMQLPEFETVYSNLQNKFDTVFLLNVLEHLENDSYAIQNCRFLLKEKGTLLILVPAYNFLFSDMDKQLNHYRRYSKIKLSNLIKKQGFKIENSYYFNCMGIPAWLYGKLRRYKQLPAGEMKFYNKLTPIGKFLDFITFRRVGLSVVVAAKKDSNS